MRTALTVARALLFSAILASAGATACTDGGAEVLGAPRPQDQPRAEIQAAADYGNCPSNPQAFCTYSDPGSEVTGYCTYEGCFQMSYGSDVRVVAADEQGAYPRTWFAWHEGTMTPLDPEPCVLTEKGKKTRVDLPADQSRRRCSTLLTTADGQCYHEHFASNPTNGCLAWLECRMPPLP